MKQPELWTACVVGWTLCVAPYASAAEKAENIRELKLRDWQPEVLEKIYSKNGERMLLGAPDDAETSPAAFALADESKEKPAPMLQKLLHVKRTDDFKITGDGTAAAWRDVAWVPLAKRTAKGHDYDARVKMLYSKTGLYVLFTGSDKKLTATLREDFLDLWNEDVFEFFFWPDERQTIYFEYEISPLGYELPILVPNVDDQFLGWRPWHYEGERKIQKATTVAGGKKESGAAITGWTAEVFLPYALLTPLGNVPPKPGTRWRANFYRVDYDDGVETSWDWARVGPSFHEFRKFGTLVFD